PPAPASGHRTAGSLRGVGERRSSRPGGPAPLASARGVRLVSRGGAISVGGHQVGVGTRFAGQRLEVVTDGAHAAVLVDGELLRRIDIDPGAATGVPASDAGLVGGTGADGGC